MTEAQELMVIHLFKTHELTPNEISMAMCCEVPVAEIVRLLNELRLEGWIV